jgi:deoxyadenosine/deoxycytidine kinase
MPNLICINGNIACGKSTLLKSLEKRGHRVVLEGLDRGQWGNILELYYRDPQRYGYLFQTRVLADMKKMYGFLKKDDPGEMVFVERSPLDCMAFSQVVYENGNMSEEEYTTFKSLYELLYDAPRVIISLNLSPKVCFERCKARGRPCEKEISLEYLESIERCTNRVMKNTSNNIDIRYLDVYGKSTSQIVQMVENMLTTLSAPGESTSYATGRGSKG